MAGFDDFPEVLTGAGDQDEVRRLAADALEETVLAYMASGREIPPPRPASPEETLVILDVITAARAALARSMKAHGIGATTLARRLRKTEGAVRRLVDGTKGREDRHGPAALASVATLSEGIVSQPALALVG